MLESITVGICDSKLDSSCVPIDMSMNEDKGSSGFRGFSLEAVTPSGTELSHKITRIQAALALSFLKPTSQPVKAVRPATEKGAKYSVLANLA